MATLSLLIKQIPMTIHFSKTSPSTLCFVYFSLVSVWHYMATIYAEGWLNEGREVWGMSFPCNEAAALQISSFI